MFDNLFIIVGRHIISFFYFLGGLANLTFKTIYFSFTPPYKKDRILEQAKKAGLDSLPLVSLIALFIGFIFALQTAYFMQRIGSELYIASLVALSIVRELGPVITALVVAGRVGAAITAEIGSMQVTEQIDALETFATNPVKYLVVPRFLALSLMLPILTLYADAIGILGSYLICVFRLGISSSIYLRVTFEALWYKDIFTGLSKTIFFGMIIAIISCYEGFNVKGGAEGVGRATTRSVVFSFIMIIVADCVFTALFYFIFP
ncbi:MAG: ABC transporter permease [Candidatus Omnitrophica bacterium]|jgi:phospholipid/cholesterol/gamma-HCH transport system permease protein|nr:ABC transporter permease [Candidatus Omnitrophota bacterium]MDD5664935.1 ABC transporter permease [Candidatus Omnitrophota bacterium]